MKSEQKPIPLRMLIGGALAIWATVCLFIHGQVIVMYVALQVATAGLFVWEMRRVEKKSLEAKLTLSVETTATEMPPKEKAA